MYMRCAVAATTVIVMIKCRESHVIVISKLIGCISTEITQFDNLVSFIFIRNGELIVAGIVRAAIKSLHVEV